MAKQLSGTTCMFVVCMLSLPLVTACNNAPPDFRSVGRGAPLLADLNDQLQTGATNRAVLGAPGQQLKLLTERLQVARKGIILLHDPKAQTAAMLPAFLRYLRDNHYRVVQLVPAPHSVGVARVP